ncbi:MAG: hypothetical protein ACKV2T_36090 [Kofleriaceae bacterium]
MCCFSVATPIGLVASLVRAFTPPVHVSSTNIFARMLSPGVQGLAYSMNINAKKPVAMILPLPVVPGSGEDAVKFISLEKHEHMFTRFHDLFEIMAPLARKGGPRLSFGIQRQTLVIHKVGSFIASYVPSRADFTRLDTRFRMPEVLFDAVPAYADYGFAVFQLEPGKKTIHPMALSFPTRAPDQLFFPTVHVHDGTFKPTAKFDHSLYYQTKRCQAPSQHIAPGAFEGDAVGWGPPQERYEGLVEAGDALLRRKLRARLPNVDTWIAA